MQYTSKYWIIEKKNTCHDDWLSIMEKYIQSLAKYIIWIKISPIKIQE